MIVLRSTNVSKTSSTASVVADPGKALHIDAPRCPSGRPPQDRLRQYWGRFDRSNASGRLGACGAVSSRRWSMGSATSHRFRPNSCAPNSLLNVTGDQQRGYARDWACPLALLRYPFLAIWAAVHDSMNALRLHYRQATPQRSWLNVTSHLTAERITHQITEAFP
jgi:hypothetical protein